MLRVFNTLTRTKEEFTPVTPGKVGMYLCGPTVYKPSHIGHMVGPTIFDTIKRYLVYSGYDVTWVVNITDVDDKLIAESNARGIPMNAVADEMTADYKNNLKAMGVDSINVFPKATEYIGQIIDFTQELINKGFAYESEGDVYFDVEKFPEYGKLSNRTLEQMSGEGGGTADRKRSNFDFALWKSAKPGEPSWDSPWGKGRPGWHIECSVMSGAILGETFDIHGGGLDLQFPHHENEIAQSEARYGKPMAKYWMHNGLMQASNQVGKVGGRKTRDADDGGAKEGDLASQEAGKISKSKGASAFRDLLKKFKPVFTNRELWFYFGIMLVAAGIITYSIYPTYNDFGTSARHSCFQVASLVSTTGYSTVDFDLWPDLAKGVLFILMFLGGCAGNDNAQSHPQGCPPASPPTLCFHCQI